LSQQNTILAKGQQWLRYVPSAHYIYHQYATNTVHSPITCLIPKLDRHQ
jgi:hypothetical protein